MVAQSSEVVSTVPGATLTRPEWLTARITEMGRSWGTSSTRIAGTLWWCMVASALVEPLARAAATGQLPPEPALDRIDCEIRPDGGVERVRIAACDAPDAARSAAVLRETLAVVIPAVAAVSGAGVPSLWAIAADAMGNRALDAGNGAAGAELASEVGGKLPVPRFVEIGSRTFVRRISCCLVFEIPGCEMCTSCPKRPAADREALLAKLASGA
ncbi:Ferric iron reductase protein FhuF, involved in iron transport [Nocardia amikacinitolerans]|nr:Ferric iron reductase protein FhuF, involved in iron transport [Nocardia amikacinitolerans]